MFVYINNFFPFSGIKDNYYSRLCFCLEYVSCILPRNVNQVELRFSEKFRHGPNSKNLRYQGQLVNFAKSNFANDEEDISRDLRDGDAAAADDDDDEDDEDDKGEPEESLSAFPDLVPENRLSSSGKEEHKKGEDEEKNLEDLSGEVVKSQVKYENEARWTKTAEICLHTAQPW